MVRADRKPVQSWREIAAEAAKETDPKKLVALVETLCEALETIRLERGVLGNPLLNPPLPEPTNLGARLLLATGIITDSRDCHHRQSAKPALQFDYLDRAGFTSNRRLRLR